MPSHGDIYSYDIDVSANTQDVVALERGLDHLGDTTKEVTVATTAATAATINATRAERERMFADAAESNVLKAKTVVTNQVTAATNRAAAATREAGSAATMAAGSGFQGGAGGRFGGTGFSGWANAIAGVSVLMDDLQYGSRNVANNLIFLGSVAPHPALKILGVTAGLLTSTFHKQIDAALGLGYAYKGLGKDAEDAEGQLKSLGDQMSKRLATEAANVQASAVDIAKSIEGLSAAARGKFEVKFIDMADNDVVIADLQAKVDRLKHHIANSGLSAITKSRLKASIDDTLNEIQKAIDERRGKADERMRTLIAEAAKGNSEALENLAIRLRQVGQATGDVIALDLADELDKQTEAYARLTAKADQFAQSAEDAAEKDEALMKQIIKDLKEAEAESKRVAAEEKRRHEESLRRKQAEADADARAREGRQAETAGIQANAFRGMTSGGIQETMRTLISGGATQEQAQRAAFEQTFQFLRQSGLGDVNAANTANQLVEEQAGFLRQMVANIDAMLGAMVGMQRQNTWGRKITAIQANQIRAMQIRNMNQDQWRNNRPGWP